MATTTSRLLRFMQNVRTHAPGALDDVIQMELYNTLKELCSYDIWKNTSSLRVNTTKLSYYINPTDIGLINRLISVKDSGDVDVPGTMETPGTLVLNNYPSQTQTLSVTVSMTVIDPVDTNNYPQFPTWVLDKYDTCLMEGTIGRMQAQPAKTYTNANMSVYHLRRFRSLMAQARAEATHKNVGGGQNWSYPQNFKTHRRH